MSVKPNRGFFDLQIDFFLPVWRRCLLVAFCAVWSLFEFMRAAPLWGIIIGAMAILAAWQLFFDGWPGDKNSESEKPTG